MTRTIALSLVIYFLGTSSAVATWVVESLSGGLQSSQKLEKGQALSAAQTISATSGSSLRVRQGRDGWSLRFEKKSSIQLLPQGADVVVRLLSGGVTLLSAEDNQSLLVVDFGEWRLRKKNGTFKIHGSTKDAWVSNEKGVLWLKKDDAIELAKEIPAMMRFRIQEGQFIFAFEEIDFQPKKIHWELTESGRAISSEKSSKSFCSDPSGEYEQCAWKCMGPHNKQKFCDTGRPAVRCLRFTCSADGKWKLPTLVPGGECLSQGVRIDQCQ